MPLALVAVVGLFGFNFQLTLPLLAKTVFHSGATAFGLLTTAFAAGSLLAAFATTVRSARPAALTVTASALAFGSSRRRQAGRPPTRGRPCCCF
ncbi:hypothetical protein O1M63_20155 [Streptomyces mirabilis]|nr:hypothetical protein [Streptomyces mirabilis]